ncbi:MAG: hypothetical protein MJY80_07345 [Bacteroidales bacterium]|nr:hypothetical protein [Bacteroidales bacterium]
MKNYSKIFKWLMVGLIAISVILLVWGFVAGFESNGGKAVDVMFYWTYIMIALSLIAVVVFGVIISFKNNPKSIVKLGIGIVAVAAICFVVYLISPGKPAMGMLEQPDQATLRLTDTVLNLTYIAGVCAIIAIIAGEIVMSIRNKK